ncbi:MAG: TIR domain-containing protein [Acidobacteriia bacterium]|nr:TIR domain-containing protein [Terriglobia bacterium]
MAQVFTSYSRKDKDFVRKLSDALAHQKRDAWIDWKDIPLTAEWQQEILTNIEGAENFLFVISPDSATSPNCRKEIDHAVANNKRMFPIVRRQVPDDAVPEALRKFQWIDFSDDDSFEARFATLIAALDTDLAWVNVHTRLLIRAKEWEREGKDSSFLLRGKDLREAEQWVAKSAEKEPKPTTLHSHYILASRQAATKLQRVIIGAVAAAFVIAVGLAVYAFIQNNLAQRNARESRARELAALSTVSLSEDPEKSILLGMQAVNATLRFGQPPLPAAEEALRQAILSSQVRTTLRGHSGGVNGVAFSPDGKRLATASDDQTAKVWDAESGKELLTLRGHSRPVCGVAFRPDGKRLATACGDQTAKVWDAESGKELLTLRSHSDVVDGVTFSPDGKRLATASADGTVQVDSFDLRELLNLGRSRVTRTFAAEECQLYFQSATCPPLP